MLQLSGPHRYVRRLTIFSKFLNTFNSALFKISVMLEEIDPIAGAENLKNILLILKNTHFSLYLGLLTTMVVLNLFSLLLQRSSGYNMISERQLCRVGHGVLSLGL